MMMKKSASIAIVLLSTLSFFVPTSAYAETEGESHAAVVIDTGDGPPKTACITFRGDSISGAEALELANAQPVYQSFSGVGRAVCTLCGVGCPSGDSCLTCAGSTFWNYFQSKSGTDSFTSSGIGAGNSQVRNGDVEGWKFGVGQKPPYLSYNTICGIQISEGTSVSQPPSQGTVKIQTPKKVEQASQLPQNPTDIPSSVLGKTITRESTAMKSDPQERESQESPTPRIFGAFVLIAGLSATGYFLYRSRHKKVTN